LDLHTLLNHIEKLNNIIKHYYGKNVTYEKYVLNKEQIDDNIKFLLTDEILLNLINSINQDNTLKLMETIINTLNTDLWSKYFKLLKYGINKVNFIKSIGIYLLKLNPCPNYYNNKNHFKSLLELDESTIKAIKPEFMNIFRCDFRLILKNESKYYYNMDKINEISENIRKIFD
jgi:hypothetical protein